MNKNYGRFGIATGTATTPAATFPASDASNGIDAKVDNDAVRVTNGARDTTVGRYITDTEITAKITTLAFDAMLGQLLKAALGAVATTGSAAPYTHKFTLGESLPAVKLWQQVGASNAPVQQLSGGKVSRLGISAEGVKPPAITFEMAGTDVSWSGNTWPGGGDFDAADGWFTTAGAEVKLSLNSGTPGAVPAYMALDTFECAVESEMTPQVQFGSVQAAAQIEGSATVTATISGTTSDTQVYRAIKTGSSSGTALSSSIITGSLEVTFPHTVESDWELKIEFPAIPWEIEALGVDVEGGPFELALSTSGAIAIDGTSITVTLKDDTASY